MWAEDRGKLVSAYDPSDLLKQVKEGLARAEAEIAAQEPSQSSGSDESPAEEPSQSSGSEGSSVEGEAKAGSA
jgi:hypothetical protein